MFTIGCKGSLEIMKKQKLYQKISKTMDFLKLSNSMKPQSRLLFRRRQPVMVKSNGFAHLRDAKRSSLTTVAYASTYWFTQAKKHMNVNIVENDSRLIAGLRFIYERTQVKGHTYVAIRDVPNDIDILMVQQYIKRGTILKQFKKRIICEMNLKQLVGTKEV